jgi:glutamate decarboxylase
MVHLQVIPDEAHEPIDSNEHVTAQLCDDRDTFTSTVYGSRFVTEDLPTDEMPENEMPKEVAYRMIKDDLSLDGNPILKYVVLLTIGFEFKGKRN